MHRIVIVGGGIGGLVTATRLARKPRGSDKAEVLLVDRNRAHVWKPMLHTFAAGTSDCANENVSFFSHAKLTGCDSARRLKMLKALTSYEYICKSWTKEPERFTLNPLHQTPGSNI